MAHVDINPNTPLSKSDLKDAARQVLKSTHHNFDTLQDKTGLDRQRIRQAIRTEGDVSAQRAILEAGTRFTYEKALVARPE